MPSISVLHTASGGGPWWSWHLAWVLAEQGLDVVWVEAESDAWTTKLLPPHQRDLWSARQLGSLRDVAMGQRPDPTSLTAVEAHRLSLRILPGWPGGGRLEAKHLDTRLARWVRQQSAWVVVDLGRPWLQPCREVLAQSQAVIALAAPNQESVRDLRRVGRSLEAWLPSVRRYAFIDQARDRYARGEWDYWRCRIPAAFRAGWLGRPDASEATPTSDHPWCVGACLERPRAEGAYHLPAFRLPPASAGHGVPDAGIITARAEWEGILRGVAEAMALPLDTPEPVLVESQPPLAMPPPAGVRFAVPYRSRPDEKPLAETAGFLADEPLATPLAQVLHLRPGTCTVLMGEPGMGKSHAVRSLGPEVVALGKLGTAELKSLLEDQGPAVVLDGVDEWTGDLSHLRTTLKAWLKRCDPRPALAVAGRPGAHLDQVHATLVDVYGDVPRYLLQPLRRADVAAFVPAPADFLQEVDRLELHFLAARPITLQLLAHLWHPPAPLPGDRVEIYRQGVDHLIRHHFQKGGPPDPKAVREAAQRIAWVAVLQKQVQGRVGVGAGYEIDLFDLQTHFPERALGDYEAALACPLFDGGRFVHATFAEYLAAEHAALVRLPVLMQWLFSHRRILHEHLAGLASWLVAMNSDVAVHFVRADPGRLLVQRAQVHPEARAAWLEALIAAQRRGELTLWRHDLRELVDPQAPHPEVAARARTLVTERDDELVLAGIRLLTHLKDHATLAQVADGDGFAPVVRWWAVTSLHDLGATQALLPLRRLLGHELPGDEHGRLRGAIIEALWPQHLSAAEAICLLPQPRGEADAHYGVFLDQQGPALVDDLDEAGIIATLGWLAERRIFARHDLLHHHWPFETPLLRKAWALADTPAVAEALGRLLGRWIKTGDQRLEALDVDWYLPTWDRSVRVLQGLVATVDLSVPFWWRELVFTDLMPPFEVLVEQAEAAPPEQARGWLDLTRVWRLTPEQAARLAPLSNLAPWIDAELRTQAQPQPQPTRTRVKERLPVPRVQRVKQLIQRAMESPAWWVELSPLFHPEHRHEIDYWAALEPEEQTQAKALAQAFLRTASGDQAACTRDRRWRKAAAHAWLWLKDEAELSDAFNFWAPAVLIETRPTEEPWAHAVQARPGLADEVRCAIDWCPSEAHRVIRWLNGPWPPRLEAQVQALLEVPHPTEPGPEAEQRRLRLEIDQGRLLEVLLAPAASAAAASRRETFWRWGVEHLPTAWVAEQLLQAEPLRLWNEVRDRFMAEDAFARALGPSLVGRGTVEPWWVRLPDGELADLYLRLVQLYPPIERPSGQGFYLQPSDTLQMQADRARSILIQRGAVEAITRIVEGAGWHPSLIVEAERVRAHLDEHWSRPQLADLARLTPRLATARDLLWLVVDALAQVQLHDLDGELSVYRLFFDNNRKKRKPEVEVCPLVAKLLALRLGHHVRPAVIDLEPQTHGGDHRVDFVVTAPGDGGRLLRLKIECKWSNHKQVKTAIRDQLPGYLRESPEAAGLYLVLWTNLLAGYGDPEVLEKHLREQAQTLALPPHRHTIEVVLLRLQKP